MNCTVCTVLSCIVRIFVHIWPHLFFPIRIGERASASHAHCIIFIINLTGVSINRTQTVYYPSHATYKYVHVFSVASLFVIRGTG